MPGSGPLLRPSSLARFWELHPKTVVQWIRDGRLPAIRTPGAQWRVRPSDLVEFCARASLPLPPSARPRVARVNVVGATPGAARAIARSLAEREAEVEAFAEPIDGLLATVRAPPSAIAIDASSKAIDAMAAVRALRRGDAKLVIVAFGASSAAKARALLKAGATRALTKDDAPSLAATLAALISA